MMLNVIKEAALAAVEAGKPLAVIFGEVAKIDPLEVNVDQRFILDADFLVLPESLTRYEIDLNYNGTAQKITIREGLKQGDKVILFRLQGGQKYFIADKVVSSE